MFCRALARKKWNLKSRPAADGQFGELLARRSVHDKLHRFVWAPSHSFCDLQQISCFGKLYFTHIRIHVSTTVGAPGSHENPQICLASSGTCTHIFSLLHTTIFSSSIYSDESLDNCQIWHLPPLKQVARSSAKIVQLAVRIPQFCSNRPHHRSGACGGSLVRLQEADEASLLNKRHKWCGQSVSSQ